MVAENQDHASTLEDLILITAVQDNLNFQGLT
jgi:hypothetical protein